MKNEITIKCYSRHGQYFVTENSDRNWKLKNFDGGFTLEYSDDKEDVFISCMVLRYIENTENFFISMVGKNGKLPIKSSSYNSNSIYYIGDINATIQELLIVPQSLLLNFLLKGKFRSSELIEMLEFNKRFETYDYALPQGWLDDFSKFSSDWDERITYNLILSTTVWAYEEKSRWGKAVSACTEINDAIAKYNSHKDKRS